MYRFAMYRSAMYRSAMNRPAGSPARRRPGVVGAALIGACLVGVAPVGAASEATAAATPPGVVVDRTVRDPDISEASGLALSPSHPGVLWTVNDSGHPPVLLGLGVDGRTVARVRLSGVPDVDWEAVAAWRDPRGRALLAAADIGDNRSARAGVEIDVVAEPARLGSSTVPPLRRLRLTYPDGPRDAEALLVDPRSGRLYVATKGFDTRIYAVPEAVWPGTASSGTFRLVATSSVFFVTDGAMLPGGQLLLRTYGSLVLLPSLGGSPEGAGPVPDLRALALASLPRQPQGEGMAVDAGRRLLYLASEGVSQPVLRLDVPADVAAAAGLSATAGSAGATGTTGTTAPTGVAAPTSQVGATGPSTLTDLTGSAGATGAAGAAGSAERAAGAGPTAGTWVAGTAGALGLAVLANAVLRRLRRRR
jgi:hypothetical protein